jgi:hypothetical protein
MMGKEQPVRIVAVLHCEQARVVWAKAAATPVRVGIASFRYVGACIGTSARSTPMLGWFP